MLAAVGASALCGQPYEDGRPFTTKRMPAKDHGVVLRHGMRNAATAPLAMTALQIRLIFGNLLIVEQIFARPGLGLYTVQAFASADLPAVLGVSMVFGTFYILVSILIEIGQSLADPRIAL